MQMEASPALRPEPGQVGEDSWDHRGEKIEFREAALASVVQKRPYSPPVLEVFGDIRDVTLGPSPGVGESGAPSMFKP
ncbi:MAG: lasso RiPP family leader peptide-containing protein [Deltaproteobacteria bacterium]|nr:lasso RiPP family leader peptide-containing protein [Deltaproteobacteria bacterium]